MKVFTLTALLISVLCVEGGLIKRQAEEESAVSFQGDLSAKLTTFFQELQREADKLVATMREKFGQTTVDDIRTQAETALQQLQNSFTPLTEQVRQNVAQLFPNPGQAQEPAQGEA